MIEGFDQIDIRNFYYCAKHKEKAIAWHKEHWRDGYEQEYPECGQPLIFPIKHETSQPKHPETKDTKLDKWLIKEPDKHG